MGKLGKLSKFEKKLVAAHRKELKAETKADEKKNAKADEKKATFSMDELSDPKISRERLEAVGRAIVDLLPRD